MSRTASLKYGDQSIELPVVEGTENEFAIDITQLRAKTGLITLDPGFGKHRRLREQDHVHRRREGDLAVPGHPDRTARREVDLFRDGLAPNLRATADDR